MRTVALLIALMTASTSVSWRQTRDEKVRGDRDSFAESLDWIYNDLSEGFAAGKAAGKPLLVVVRCIPCEACQKFDDDVARRDPIIRDLMDDFVCVRLIQANTLDLGLLQYDYDQSMAIVFLHPDGTVLGRFGTRSERYETEDISLIGLRAAMEQALVLSSNVEQFRPSLQGKQPLPVSYATPLEFPNLAGRYGKNLDYQGEVAKSCIHCHQVREAERHVFRDNSKPIPDEVLFPYPDPSVLGLKINPESLVEVEQVEPSSIADQAGIAEGDRIATFDGQPILSTADIQWVLHRTPSGAAELTAEVERDGKLVPASLKLPEDWRRSGNLSWRVSTWDLRREGFGGMKLRDLKDDARADRGLADDVLALQAEHVGQYGEHAIAKRAGLVIGDVIVGFDGKDDRLSETELLTHVLQNRDPGDPVELEVLRADGKRETITLTLP